MVLVMKTDGGAHPADKWADKTADDVLAMLVDVNPDNVTPQAQEARRIKRELRPQLFELFETHHADVMGKEAARLEAHILTFETADVHTADRHDPEPFREDILKKVNAIFAKTPWAAQFMAEEIQQRLWQLIGQDTVDVMHIERLHHRDRLQAKEAVKEA